MTTAAPRLRPVRVAVYARASVSKGAEFDSVTAQSEAVAAYVASQRSLGWTLLPDAYVDDGYSGGDVERPAFQRLMADVVAGRVDAVGCYKLDRISRSLFDFGRIIETLEKRGVALFSVTQQFSTQTSLGKLTLGILMSFAQFEREQISERITDKMQATRRRGSWTGGRVPLGYDVVDKKLVVNADEAAQVRAIFQLYLERGSLRDVVAELGRRGWTTKGYTGKRGQRVAGHAFAKPSLHGLLTNEVYAGKQRTKGGVVPGVHAAIVDEQLWNAVQEQLRANGRVGGAEARNKTGAILRGLIRCGRCGSPMLHTFSTKGSKRYRFYTCSKAHNEGVAACPGSRVAAGPFEKFVVEQVRRMGTDEVLLAKTAASATQLASERRVQLVAERRLLEQQQRRGDGDDTQRAQRLAEIEREVEALGNGVDTGKLRSALAEFVPVWAQLSPAEQERVLRLLVERVTYHPDDKNVDIELRPCGIETLAAEATP